jgi:hypothetical protein
VEHGQTVWPDILPLPGDVVVESSSVKRGATAVGD